MVDSASFCWDIHTMRLRFALAAAAALALLGACPEEEWVGPADDDDAGDDDDTYVNDPSCSFDEVTMTVDYDVTTVGEGDDVRRLVTGTYGFHYWEDIREGVPLCDQRIAFEGEAWFGPGSLVGRAGAPDCERCSGYLTLDPASIVETTDPAANPDDCDAADLEIAVNNWGVLLTTPVSPTTHGDFLQMALLDAATQEEHDVKLRIDEESTGAAALREKWAEAGLVYTHAGYVHAYQGSLAITACTFLLSGTPEPDSAYLSAWEITRRAADILVDSPDGAYSGIAFFSSPY